MAFLFLFFSEILPWGGDLVFARVSHMWPSHVLIRLGEKNHFKRKQPLNLIEGM